LPEMKKPIALIAGLLILFFLSLAGCGDDKAVPDRSTITINPASVSLKNILGNTMVDFKVIVRYSNGTPMPDAKIHITGAFAEPTVAAQYQFYSYPGGDGVLNTPVNSGFNAQTDEYGVYDFSLVVYGPGSGFDDTIYVSSGTAVGTATIKLTMGT